MRTLFIWPGLASLHWMLLGLGATDFASDFVRSTATFGTGKAIGTPTSGRGNALAAAAVEQQTPAAPENGEAEPTLRQAAGDRLLIGAAVSPAVSPGPRWPR